MLRLVARAISVRGSAFLARLPSSLRPYARLMRLDSLTGVYTVTYPGLHMLAMSNVVGACPSATLIGTFVVGGLLARASAVTVNDILDRRVDAQVHRTRHRPLASGEVSVWQATTLSMVLGASSIYLLGTLQTPTLMVGLCAVPLVLWYPLAKRGVLMAASECGLLGEPFVLLLYAASCAHTIVYDSLYARQDMPDDVNCGVHSLPLSLGERGTLRALTMATLAMAGSLWLCGWMVGQTTPYYAAVLVVSLALVRQVWHASSVALARRHFDDQRLLGAILLAGIVVGGLVKNSRDHEDTSK